MLYASKLFYSFSKSPCRLSIHLHSIDMPNASKPFIRNINQNAKQRKHQIGQQYFPRKVVPSWRRGNPLQFLPLTRTPGWRVGRGARFKTRRRVVPRGVMLRLLSIPRIRELNRPSPPPPTPQPLPFSPLHLTYFKYGHREGGSDV